MRSPRFSPLLLTAVFLQSWLGAQDRARVVIDFQSAGRCRVRAEIRAAGPGEEVHHWLLLQPGQRIGQLSGADMQFVSERLLRLSAAPREAVYQIGYQVDLASDPRVPLPVPLHGSQGTVQVELRPPPGWVATGTRFPGFLPAGESLRVSLASFPGFAMATLRPDRKLSWLDRVWSVGILTDAGILLLIAAASLAWWILRRPPDVQRKGEE